MGFFHITSPNLIPNHYMVKAGEQLRKELEIEEQQPRKEAI
jgi:hypothetical protein